MARALTVEGVVEVPRHHAAGGGSAQVRESWARVVETWVRRAARAIACERERGAAPLGLSARDLAIALTSMTERVLHATFARVVGPEVPRHGVGTGPLAHPERPIPGAGPHDGEDRVGLATSAASTTVGGIPEDPAHRYRVDRERSWTTADPRP
ncbi:hypothetical protein [Embleya sp. AB8]|uniref:hypothetical protein n=1 Tax=Embleya sp. AB8 TaxID=3156304 RepID=UPI003C727DB0